MLENVSKSQKVLFTNGKTGKVTKKTSTSVFIKTLGSPSRIPLEYGLDGALLDGGEVAVAGIVEMYDFGDGNGAVEAARHINPQGDTGGLFALTATVGAETRLSRGSRVFGNATISGASHLTHKTMIGGDATIKASNLRACNIAGEADITDCTLKSMSLDGAESLTNYAA